MITKCVKFFMQRPVIFWSLMAAIIIAGVLAFVQMPKLEDPAVSAKQASVVVVWPGASAHEMELKVAQPVEDALRTLPDVKKVKTECKNGTAVFTVEFLMTVLNEDLEQHFDLVRRKASDVAARLPQGCYAPVVIDDMMDVYGIFYSLTGDGYNYPEMEKYAKLLRRNILSVKGVKRVNIIGTRDEVINITLSREQIARNGIVPTQIMTALQAAGKNVNAGHDKIDGERIALYVDNAVKNEDDIRNLQIQTLDGKRLRIGDIARVERGFSEPQRNGFFVNGKPSLAICVAMENSAIVPDVGKAVDVKVNETMKQVPAGVHTEKIFFQPDKVSEAVSSFMWNLVESVAIVILVLIFTMGWRSGVIMGFGLILTVAVSFPILLTCGTTLQRISLGAFIVAMGMLVDNAVVIMDGILVDRKRGLPSDIYLYRIGQNTALPLLGATVIAASTFLCVYLSPDTSGEYARDLFLVLCVSLLASWVLALVQVPVCAKAWLPKRVEKTGDGSSEAVLNSPVHRFIRRAISFLIGHKAATIGVAVVVLSLSVFGMTKVKNLFFPDFDYKQFVVECYFPSASNANAVRDRMLQMSREVQKNPNVERVAMSQGSAPALYCLVRPMTSGGDCYGELIVDCKDYKTVVSQIPVIRKQLREEYPEAYIRIRKYNFSTSTSHTVEVEFAGPDPAVLRDLSAQAESIMRKSPYVDAYSVQNNWKPRGKKLVAEYNQADALRSGIERSDVANALLAATDGMTIGALNDNDHTVLLNLQVRNADGSRIGQLDEIPVWSTLNAHLTEEELQKALAGGKAMSELQDKVFRATPLANVASGVRLDWDEDVVMRLNGQRVIEAECDPNPDLSDATPAKVQEDIREGIENIKLPAGYSMRWVGEGEVQGEAIGNLMKYVPITIFLILIILLFLFNSWRKVILILMCFPFVCCGITPALFFSGQPMTFMAIIGVMGLVGMMVKNAIVLVDEINRLQTEEGAHPYHAVIEATVSRVRPVLMASLTTIVGMIPLVGDPMYSSMAITIMSGLTMGTIITLILLPLFYTALFRIKAPAPSSSSKHGAKVALPLIALLVLVPMNTQAQTVAAGREYGSERLVLSQSECRARATRHSEQLEKSANAVSQAKLESEIARTALLPKLDASAMGAYMFPDMDMMGMKLQMRGTYLAGLNLTQPLYTGGKIKSGQRLAAIGEKVAGEQQRMTRMDVILEADRAYFTYMAVGRKVRMLHSYKAQMDTLYQQTATAVSVGLATENDLLRIEARRSDIDYQLQKAENGADLCRMSLCNLIGVELDTPVEISDTMPQTTLPASLVANTDNRPEVRLLQQQVEASEEQVRLARADMLPTVALTANYSYYGNIKLKGVTTVADGTAYPFSQNYRDGMGMVMLAVKIPIFSWGEKRKKVRKAQLDVSNAQLDLQRNSRLLTIEAEQCVRNVRDGYALLRTAEKGLEQANENLRVMQQRYASSLAPLTDLLDAQSQWQQAQSNLIEAQTQQKIYETEYLRATGKL